jgi:phospholipase C
MHNIPPEALMPKILPQIQNIVVVMFENRSFDNLCGWLYSSPNPQPSLYLPTGSPVAYDGLNLNLWNPSNASYFSGQPPVKVPVKQGTSNFQVPDPNAHETFDHVTRQCYGPQGQPSNPQWPMQGFVVDYATTNPPDPSQIMQAYTPAQLPVLSALARNYAISDAWFCSVPSETVPNRAFLHSGTSNGNVVNGELDGDIPDPLDFAAPTIFNVLDSMGASWNVYCDATLAPSLTRTFTPKLWDHRFDARFQGFDAFQNDCAHNSLPQYSFVEPKFMLDANDQHPPHDVAAGDQFLYLIWQAVSQSPAWNHILLVIMYDEHGGCYDHVLPPSGAVSPDSASNPGKQNFKFDRFGVRVPVIVVSPYVQASTVFRSNTSTPYDHTSILATLRDWLPIPDARMLTSARIKAAPTLEQVLTLSTPRVDKPTIAPPQTAPVPTSLALPPNVLQKSLVKGSARRLNLDPLALLAQIKTRQHAVDFFKQGALGAHK